MRAVSDIPFDSLSPTCATSLNGNAALAESEYAIPVSCRRTASREGIKKNEKDYRNVARKLNTEKLEEKLMRIAVGDVTVNTNGHARPFLRFRLRERKVGSMTTTLE